MKHFLRCFSLILALALMTSLFPTVDAAQSKGEFKVLAQQWYTNSAGFNTSDVVPAGNVTARNVSGFPELDSFLSLEDAVDLIRGEMVDREELVHVNLVCTAEDLQAWDGNLLQCLVDLATVHTGQPKEGDYLLLHLHSCGLSGGVYSENGRDYFALDLRFSYYSDAEQEAELDRAVAQLIEELPFNVGDYLITSEIYQYITEHVRYDEENLYDQSYTLKYSAYAALVQGTSVCQGYTSLMYRLLLEMGVDCRAICGFAGEPHAWNIVRIEDAYYYADATWDEGLNPDDFNYFLVGSNNFTDHFADEEFLTPEFQAAYPISATNFRNDGETVGDQSHVHFYYAEVIDPSCDRSGYTEFSCCCGDHFAEMYTDPLDHTFGEWTVSVEPTCSATGMEERRCIQCDRAETRVLPIADHHYDATVVTPTCVEKGYTTYLCVCGKTYTGDEVAALGHNYVNGSCIRCHKADPDKVPVSPFADVLETDYFLNPVLWAVDKGITAGTGNGNFSPSATCTRGQVVTFLWRAKGQPEPTTSENPFSDVSPADYFYKAVLWAMENGITSGTGNGKFSPGNPCTRDQVVTFLWRAMDKPVAENRNNPFTDVAEGAYFYEPVLWAVENGITSGTSATTFAPSNPCTRGQVVTFLYRAYR